MIDLVSLTIKAGDGGYGRVSFRREKYVPKGGPDGGYGGDGGSVVIVGSRHFNTLKHYAGKKKIIAPAGKPGSSRKKTGPKGEDVVIEVPVGTVVWLTDENQASLQRREKYGIEHTLTRGEIEFETYSVQKETELPPARVMDELPIEEEQTGDQQQFSQQQQKRADIKSAKAKLVEITESGQRVVLCQGGFGGRGNIAYKSSTNITPLLAEYGTFGEQKQITLELKLLADIGLVGYPNAGKSTLLAKVTKANPKTADYPFTTLEPNLGVLNLPEGKDLVMADIPGLIEGASEGKGLGHEFLRHIENCQRLVFVLFLEESIVTASDLSNQEKAQQVWQQYQQLIKELVDYQAGMLKKPYLVSLNKIDIYSAELVTAIEARFKKEGEKIIPFSGFTGKGLEGLLKAIARN